MLFYILSASLLIYAKKKTPEAKQSQVKVSGMKTAEQYAQLPL